MSISQSQRAFQLIMLKLTTKSESYTDVHSLYYECGDCKDCTILRLRHEIGFWSTSSFIKLSDTSSSTSVAHVFHWTNDAETPTSIKMSNDRPTSPGQINILKSNVLHTLWRKLKNATLCRVGTRYVIETRSVTTSRAILLSLTWHMIRYRLNSCEEICIQTNWVTKLEKSLPECQLFWREEKYSSDRFLSKKLKMSRTVHYEHETISDVSFVFIGQLKIQFMKSSCTIRPFVCPHLDSFHDQNFITCRDQVSECCKGAIASTRSSVLSYS